MLLQNLIKKRTKQKSYLKQKALKKWLWQNPNTIENEIRAFHTAFNMGFNSFKDKLKTADELTGDVTQDKINLVMSTMQKKVNVLKNEVISLKETNKRYKQQMRKDSKFINYVKDNHKEFHKKILKEIGVIK